MIVKQTTNDFFDNPKGLIIDNSYDPYVLRFLVNFYEENKIEYLHTQDYDLGFLKYFPSVKFLSFSDEAYNFDELNNLTQLSGVTVLSNQLNNISRSILDKLEYLEIFFRRCRLGKFWRS